MATLRELKGRIGSVASSEKITGAMKMISSAKMHKAEQQLKRLQPFRGLINDIIGNLMSTDAEFSTPLTEERPVEHLTIIVWGSDDGLCGAYNQNIYKQLVERLDIARRELGADTPVRIIAVGGKVAKAVRKLGVLKGVTVSDPEPAVNSKSGGDDVKAFLQALEKEYTDGATDRVDILYTAFETVSRQRPRYEQLLPVSAEGLAGEGGQARPCIFEPSAEAIFASVLPMYLLAVLQDVFTENRASEQAARIMAMQAANDNAKKLLEQLRLEYNKLRQQAITSELLDIVGGQIR